METLKKKVLVVDDDEVIRDLLINFLKFSGYDGIGAQNGQAALDVVLVDPPDMIITDIHMPYMNGFQLLRNSNCASVAPGLVAWWAAEGNANDVLGNHSGVLSNGVAFAPGKVGQAFSFDGTNDFVRVDASPGLDVGTGVGLTIEGWIQTVNPNAIQPMVEWNDGVAAISVDPPDVSQRQSRKLGYTFPLLSDPHAKIIRRYDVLHPGAGPKGADIARPAEFLLDSDGIVRWVNLTDNIAVRARPEQVLAAFNRLSPAGQ